MSELEKEMLNALYVVRTFFILNALKGDVPTMIERLIEKADADHKADEWSNGPSAAGTLLDRGN